LFTTGEGEVKKFLLTGLAFSALVLPAAAADMPIKALPPAPIDIWTGGYVGANVGYGWANDAVQSVGGRGTCTQAGAGCLGGTADAVSPAMAQALTFQTSINRSGVIYGGQAGHNWLVRGIFASDRVGTWDGVLGVEVDFQGLSDSHSSTLTGGVAIPGFPTNPISQTATLSDKLTTLGTARGRAGVLWGPSTLFYATAGVAWASVQETGSFNQLINGTVGGGTAPYFGTGTVNTEQFGPVVGGGVEWKWTANWSVKAEYLYADLGHATINTSALIAPQTATGLTFGSATANINTHIHENIARVGVNYKFW
jgi:outer membrane immunogenic protein